MRIVDVTSVRPASRSTDWLKCIWDKGITYRRLDGVETLDVLSVVLAPNAKRAARRKVSGTEIEAAAAKAAARRHRRMACPVCDQRAEGTRETIVFCGRCWLRDSEMVQLKHIDPLPEEILAMAAGLESAA